MHSLAFVALLAIFDTALTCYPYRAVEAYNATCTAALISDVDYSQYYLRHLACIMDEKSAASVIVLKYFDELDKVTAFEAIWKDPRFIWELKVYGEIDCTRASFLALVARQLP